MSNFESLHEHILAEVKEKLLTRLSYGSIEELRFTDKQLLNYLFKNYRYDRSGHKGIRLTYEGHTICSGVFKSYSYELAAPTSNQAKIALDKNMLWPYYIGKQCISFYSEEDAAWFQLNGSDINSFTDFI